MKCKRHFDKIGKLISDPRIAKIIYLDILDKLCNMKYETKVSKFSYNERKYVRLTIRSGEGPIPSGEILRLRMGLPNGFLETMSKMEVGKNVLIDTKLALA